MDATTPPAPGPGGFSIEAGTDRWTWSDGLFAIHGMQPGDVLPSRDILLRHARPEDRDALDAALEEWEATGRAVGLQYALVDLGGTEHVVVLCALARTPTAEGGAGVRRGVVVDVTGPHRRRVAREVDHHLETALASRAVIDQAKGALMTVYGMDADEAFDLLRWSSRERNVRLAELAQRLVQAVSRAPGLGVEARAELDELFSLSFDGRVPAAPSASTDAAPGAASDHDGSGPAAPDGAVPDVRPSLLEIRTSTHDGAPVLRASGPVDLSTVAGLAGAVARASVPARSAGRLVVDLRDVTHLGSVGVALLVATHRRLAPSDVRLEVLARADSSLALADVPGLHVELHAADGGGA